MKKIPVRPPNSRSGAIEPSAPAYAITDLIGSVTGLPADLSARKKGYLLATGYGRRRRPSDRPSGSDPDSPVGV